MDRKAEGDQRLGTSGKKGKTIISKEEMKHYLLKAFYFGTESDFSDQQPASFKIKVSLSLTLKERVPTVKIKEDSLHESKVSTQN